MIMLTNSEAVRALWVAEKGLLWHHWKVVLIFLFEEVYWAAVYGLTIFFSVLALLLVAFCTTSPLKRFVYRWQRWRLTKIDPAWQFGVRPLCTVLIKLQWLMTSWAISKWIVCRAASKGTNTKVKRASTSWPEPRMEACLILNLKHVLPRWKMPRARTSTTNQTRMT